MIKNIIFDWSGTLSNDTEMVHQIMMGIFEKYGHSRISFDEFRDEFMLPYMEFYWKYLPNLKKEDQDQMFKENISRINPHLFPGAKETLEFLKIKNINMVILSSTNQDHIEEKIIENSLQNIFTEVKASVYDKIKTIPELMLKHNFKPEETIFVGDMVHDIKTGRAVGIKTLALTWGYHKKEKLAASNPDFLIDNIKKLKEIIIN